ncbi:hypothetical protein AVEN_100792-1 [Araneus ventricosus]|uniref:Uncharacterized protein n=1 Tax=Araneus ventricosus TaxID=182803 RepID=A0A4Y2AVZ2_ARAVE|nr:hypothetical protein AVEN_100792-1 [Araneus ventricosus]
MLTIRKNDHRIVDGAAVSGGLAGGERSSPPPRGVPRATVQSLDCNGKEATKKFWRVLEFAFLEYEGIYCFVIVISEEFSLVTLTSRFEATRGLFGGRPRNFESRSDDEDDKRASTPIAKLTNVKTFCHYV